MRVAVLVSVVGVATVGFLLFGNAAADYAEREDVQAYIEEIAVEHEFDRERLQQLFAGVERKQSILDAISRPAERTKAWHEYRDIFVTDKRIGQGVEFWQENTEVLERASREFGVEPRIIVSIIGVETRFGRNTGSYRVVDALTTLGFDYPPRSTFFRKELTQFLLLAREEDKDPLALKGSYAGAMGYGQFIPSSFRAYAVDFDGDGLRDIWGNTTDAIGSVANYFKRHGWRQGETVVIPVTATRELPDGIVNASLKLKQNVGQLRELGVEIDALEPQTPAALYRMEAADGPEYWLGLHNFYVITRYNRSRMYALAVVQLGDAIAEQMPDDSVDEDEAVAAQ